MSTGGEEIGRARSLILAYGWNATSYQILNPGFQLWFDERGDAVVGYVEQHGFRLVGGAPICAADRLADSAAAFEQDARRAGCRTCYFGAESRLEQIYRNSPDHAMIVLGSQPVLRPPDWMRRIANHSSLRAQLNRATNKGVVVREWAPERARDHSALHGCLGEWLDARGLPPLHFLIESDTLSRLQDRRIFVATREGDVVGFLVASPIPRRNGWLIEQLVRGSVAVNGTSEMLIDAAMRGMIDDGSDFATLGLAPLSTRTERASHENPYWLSVVLGWVRAHGRRYYNFRGLEGFKEKFRPDYWDPVYAIVDEPRFRPSTLYAIAAAFAAGSPIRLLSRAVGNVLASEVDRRLDRFWT